MIAKRRTNLLYLFLLWIVISLLVWPTFVVATTLFAYFSGQAWQLDAWNLIPKRDIVNQFLHGYINSAIVAVPLGFIAVIDHTLLSRYRVTWIFGGILLPLAGAAIAYFFYKQPETALPSLVLTGLLLAVVYRLADVVAGNSRRGRLR